MSGSGLVILFGLIAGGMVCYSLARGRTRRREASLGRLTPVVSGDVSSKDRRLRGTYRGHDVEAWATKYDPTPSSISSDSSPVEVPVFFLRIGGVPGREPWACVRELRLNPFASPTYVFEWSYGGVGALFSGLLGKVADVPEHDPGLEQRLREAGMFEAVDGFGHGSSAYLPRVRYTPALRPWLPGPSGAMRQPDDQVGELFCEVELPRDTDPSPERFGELLDRALHIVEVNSRANPGSTGAV